LLVGWAIARYRGFDHVGKIACARLPTRIDFAMRFCPPYGAVI